MQVVVRLPVVWRLKPGYAYNPTLSLPRNSRCRCGSGDKFKDCCLPRIPRYIPIDVAEEYKKHMQHPDFKFILYDKRTGFAAISDDNIKDISDSRVLPPTPPTSGGAASES